jgi:DNA-binding GntR family transcriptional regulator
MHTETERFPTLEEQTYRRLLEAILGGDYPPGMKLIGSRLAKEFHVSRITVANALKRLSSEGFVTSQPHREATVVALDEGDLYEIFLMRHALEDVVLREAALRITPETIRDLRETDRRVRQSIEHNDVAAYRASEREFHLAIYASSGLRLVATMLMDLWTRLEPYRGRRHSELGLLLESLADRAAIIDALDRRDGPEAATAMRHHVDRGYGRMLEVLRRNAVSTSILGDRPGRLRSKDSPAPMMPGSLVAMLSSLPDERRRQGRLFPIAPVLALAVLAMFCGESSVTGIARWGQQCHPAIREALGLTTTGGPSVPTMHRVLRQIDPAGLAAHVSTWLQGHGAAGRYLDETADGIATIGKMGTCLRREADAGGSKVWQQLPELAIAGNLTPESSQMRLAIAELRMAMHDRAM